MKLGLVLLLFLITAIIYGLNFFLGFFAPERYGPYEGRVDSLCKCLWAIAFILWHGGQG